VRRQEYQASVAQPGWQLRNAPQQNIRKGRLGAGDEFGGAGAEAVNVGRGDASRSKASAQFPGRIVKHRLRIVAGGKHYLPISGKATRIRVNGAEADEHAEGQASMACSDP
jgi:hypothetical protein